MRKRTVRKIWEKVNPLIHAIQGASITPRDSLDKLLARELSSLDAISKGQGGLDEWNDLVTANNLAEQLALMGVGKPEVLPVTLTCQQHLIEVAERYQRTGKMGLTGPALVALREMIEFHDLQRSSIARSVYEEAIRKVTAKIKSNHVTVNLWETLGEPR
jgi:hypothetical protein